MSRILAVTVALMIGYSAASAACTFFSYAGDELVLFGNSEDHYDERVFAWFVPATSAEYACLFVGFDTGFAQGGMNSEGLAFDAAAISSSPLNDHPERPLPDPMNFCDIVLRRCATVDEAVELMKSYNLSYVQSAQFQFTDKSGASVVVAPGPDREIAFVYADAPYQVTTNTNTAIYPVIHQSCSRHRRTAKALKRIEMGDSSLSIETFAGILGSVAVTSGSSETMYSNVFDLTSGIAYIYYRHDFDSVAVLHMDELASTGQAVTHAISELVTQPE